MTAPHASVAAGPIIAATLSLFVGSALACFAVAIVTS
jgi:hypothetical protein